MSSTALVGPRVKPRPHAATSRPAAVPSVLHIDAGHGWAGGQNQVRLLIREFQVMGLRQLCICPQGSPLHERLENEGLPVRGVPWTGPADPRAIFEIARNLRHYHLVHTHDAHALQAAIIPAKLIATPIVAARRVCFDTRAFKWNRAHRVIAVSDAVRGKLLEAGVRDKKIRVVYDGIDVQEVRSLTRAAQTLRARFMVPPTLPLVGNIGSLVAYKRQALIAQAAAVAPDIAWVIVGEGPERAHIESSIREHDAAQRVHMTGNIQDARTILCDLDVFVFPSIGEALGSSVLDAMAAGIPVTAADSGGPAEVLRTVHTATGASLFAPDDAAALARTVHSIAYDARLREAMVVAQNRRIDDFRIERTALLTLDVYREVLR